MNTLISNLPELKCTTLGIEEISCIDEYKVDAFINKISEPQFSVYKEVFGDVEVVLKIVDLGSQNSHNVTIFNSSIESYSSKTPVFNPILVNNPLTGKSNFGMLITTFYER